MINKNIDIGGNGIKGLSKAILKWYHEKGRELPWRGQQDPYLVWLSEIILQQTQVKQGLPYYLRISEAFPTIEDLAEVEDDEFYKYWQGLGYYSRAKNLLKCARIVTKDYQSKFPTTKEGLLELPGVGDYTASAIASICFNEAQLALDGNLKRVLSRLFAYTHDIQKPQSIKDLKHLGNTLLDKQAPGDFNQALMDLGSQVCKAKTPDCMQCPINEYCLGFRNGMAKDLPVKVRKQKLKDLKLRYYCCQKDGKWAVVKRSSGIWHNLYEFPGVWMNKQGQIEYQNLEGVEEGTSLYKAKHLLSHRRMEIEIFSGRALKGRFEWLSLEELRQLAFPQPLAKYLETKA